MKKNALQSNIFKRVFTAQKMKFSIKDFFSKCDQILSFLRIWSHLLKKPLMENFSFCTVIAVLLYLYMNLPVNLIDNFKQIALAEKKMPLRDQSYLI